MSKSRDYELICKIGQGSFGSVFKVRRKSDKQILVMKMIKVQSLKKKHQIKSLQEVKILSSLSNPYIVKYYDSYIENSTLHIIMEYCEKGDLSQILKKNSLPEAKIWKFFIQLCIGLEYLHSQQILHRDIKALNIFLSNDDSVRIGDMGVAKILNNSAFAQTQVGSPYYLSPELCEEKPYNEKSDIWALGCVLYEMCTGRHPFNAPNQAALILKIVKGSYQPISGDFSSGLAEIIDLCLDRDSNRRTNIKSLLLRNDIQSQVEGLGILISFGSVLYKEGVKANGLGVKETGLGVNEIGLGVKETGLGVKEIELGVKEIGLGVNTDDSKFTAEKLLEDVKKKLLDKRTFKNEFIKKKIRPFSAIKHQKSQESPIRKITSPLKVISDIEVKHSEMQENIQIERPIPSKKTDSDRPMTSQVHPYSAARIMTPFIRERSSMTPTKLNFKRFSKLNFKSHFALKKNSKRIPSTVRTFRTKESLEDIQLVQNLPDIPIIEKKSLKVFQEIPSMKKPANKKIYKLLKRPLVQPALRQKEKTQEDDLTYLKHKERESIRNEQTLKRKCSKLRSEIINLIGNEKFNEMHKVLTRITSKDEVTAEGQVKIESFVGSNIKTESNKAIYSMYRLLALENDLAKTEETIRAIRFGQVMI